MAKPKIPKDVNVPAWEELNKGAPIVVERMPVVPKVKPQPQYRTRFVVVTTKAKAPEERRLLLEAGTEPHQPRTSEAVVARTTGVFRARQNACNFAGYHRKSSAMKLTKKPN